MLGAFAYAKPLQVLFAPDFMVEPASSLMSFSVMQKLLSNAADVCWLLRDVAWCALGT